jgi:hypothetical protein
VGILNNFRCQSSKGSEKPHGIKSFWAWLPAVADVMLDVAEVGVLGEISVHLQLHVVEPQTILTIFLWKEPKDSNPTCSLIFSYYDRFPLIESRASECPHCGHFNVFFSVHKESP